MCEVMSKNIAFKKNIIVFQKKKHCFFPKNPLFSNMCTFFIPLFWNEKLSLHPLNTRKFALKPHINCTPLTAE